jgi:hypothetical protein
MDERHERDPDLLETYDVGEAFGDHDIEYWIYDGVRLVPATPDEIAALREHEAERRIVCLKRHAWRSPSRWRRIWTRLRWRDATPVAGHDAAPDCDQRDSGPAPAADMSARSHAPL